LLSTDNGLFFCCAAFNIVYHVFPRDIAIRPNMSSGEWMDGDEAVSSGNMEVQLAATGDPDFNAHFLVTGRAEGGGGHPLGHHQRRQRRHAHQPARPAAQQGGGAGQAQPQGRQRSSHPAFQRPRAAGPVPLICVTSQEEAAFVRASPAFVHAELQKLAACYLKPEFISRQDALGIYPHPLHRCYAFSIHLSCAATQPLAMNFLQSFVEPMTEE
jgi:hypothetical protein